MDYYFRGYHFKSDQLVLLKMEQTVSLRANEAKLLCLLLSDPQHVFSKDEIFENVWAGKNVAEQSIFQNISHLRAIFGDDAIITHPKKGYQWQIPLEEASKQPAKLIPNKLIEQYSNNRFKSIVLFATLSTLLVGSIWYLLSTQKALHHIVIAVTPVSINNKQGLNEQDPNQLSPIQTLFDELSRNPNFMVKPAKEGHSFNELQASPELLAANELKKNKADLILTTKIRYFQSSIFISFSLLAEHNSWQGTMSGRSLNELTSQLALHIKQLIFSNYLSTNQDNLKRINVKLQLLHDKFPDDIIVFQQLIKNEIKLGLLNEAFLLAEQLRELASQSNNTDYSGSASLLVSEILIRQNYLAKAKAQLLFAKSEFSAIGDIDGLGDVALDSALLALFDHDYPSIKKILLNSIDLLNAQGSYFKAFEHTLELAGCAGKLKQIEERDYYLAEAKRILDTHHFPTEHYSKIYFQQGLLAERAGDDKAAEKYYRWILDIFSPDQEWWHKERAQYHLSQLLIRQKRFNEAVDIFKNEAELTTKERVILALIYQGWEKPKQSIKYAKQAYRDGILAGESNASLNAALLLAELSESDASLQKDAYISFLKKDSTPYWVSFEKERLQKLGLYAQLEQ